MSYGFRSSNTGGQVVIDQDFQNYAVVASGTGQNINTTQIGMLTNDLLLIRPLSLPGGFYRSYIGNNRVITCSSGNMEWLICRVNPPAVETHGLRVFGADGAVAFDSGRRAACPSASVYLPPGVSSIPWPGPALPFGKNRYFATDGLVMTRRWGGGPFVPTVYETQRTWAIDQNYTISVGSLDVVTPLVQSTTYISWLTNTPQRMTFFDV